MDERSSSSPSLPTFEAPVTDRVWLVGAHGGAGCTTIYRSAPDVYADAGRALPISGDTRRPSRIVLCTKGDSLGLEALQGLLNEADAGLFTPSILLGVAVTVPCSRPPLVLERSRRLVCSAAPFAVRLPWIGPLMVDGMCAKYPRAYESLRRDALKSLDARYSTAS
ncbi:MULTISPECIES: hypothetical protein [Bifidobacterium]|uniref:hypothetical protein n=1 Tax=Bifidobacterium TaxID=1678 RepID=UPI0026470D9A|nr:MULTISPECIES: hypothetical protein [Bifidobacterium]MDN5978668.1 hypothetical protein [Bifidobacterium mongoliense]MDN6016748.1 hypothetical protein [Bifidobacterium mongoliense]MDN6467709.1 hypothetical protein [Bifidobacterium crudilactis]MDN6558716.1 hypothetical protein [Bifidobacterium crudilactis]MDN6772655.1 hypothetical protein [Bifidobacterium crudilactis]